MAKIIIDNVRFDYDYGCAILKMKHTECPFGELMDIWDDIVPFTFQDIATKINNLEQRRIAIFYLGLDNLQKQVSPVLIGKETISKTTTWVTAEGDIETKVYDDTYELYAVKGEKLGEGLELWRRPNDVHFVKCKDTSTDREYLIWVEENGIKRANGWFNDINPISAIAWTITTIVPEGEISGIIRQGDCVLVKHKKGTKMLDHSRHLTEMEYRTLLMEES